MAVPLCWDTLASGGAFTSVGGTSGTDSFSFIISVPPEYTGLELKVRTPCSLIKMFEGTLAQEETGSRCRGVCSLASAGSGGHISAVGITTAQGPSPTLQSQKPHSASSLQGFSVAFTVLEISCLMGIICGY